MSNPTMSPPLKERRSNRTSDGGSHNGRSGKPKPKPITRAATTACIWADVRFKGDVTIGDRTIMGPGCCCISYGGPIKIGSQNVFTECVQIINKSPDQTLEIGNLNIFETGAKIEARKVGSYNKFGAKSYVMSGCNVGNGCVIGPRVQVIKNKTVSDSTIMAGENLIQTQKAFKHRNSVYVQKMVKLLTQQFQLKKNEKGQFKNKVKKQIRSEKRYLRARSSMDRSQMDRPDRRLESRVPRGVRLSPKADVNCPQPAKTGK